MIECQSLAQARRVPEVIHIEAGVTFKAYQVGDVLPTHCVGSEPTGVPSEVTMRQARLALMAAGKLPAVDAAINAMTDEAKKAAAKIEWEYSQTVQRQSYFVQSLAPVLGLSAADLDQLFITASGL